MTGRAGVRLATTTVVISSVVLAVAAVSAFQLEPLPDPGVTEFQLEPSSPSPVRQQDELDVIRAVAANPFRPDRQRAQGRYRDQHGLEPDPADGSTELRLVGLASGGRRNLALVAFDGQVRLAAVGDSVAGYRVSRISASAVTLQGEQSTTTLELSTPLERLSVPQ